MHAALEMALVSATVALDVGAFTADSLKSGPRVALEGRKATLGAMLRPCHVDRIRAILASLAGMPSRAEDDPTKARFLAGMDVADLTDANIPEFALEAAARAFRQGAVAGRQGPWRPTVGELIDEARKRSTKWHAEQARIKRVLDAANAPVALASPKGARPVSASDWAALQASIGSLGK